MALPSLRSLFRAPAARSRRHGGLLLVLPALPLAGLALLVPPALAERPGSRPADLQQQEALALARLSTPALRDYFEARRQLERRSADQRLTHLRQLEDCLERTRLRAGAETCLQQGRQRQWQQRQQWQVELGALRQRYGLPDLEGAPQRVPQPRQSWLPNRVPAGLPGHPQGRVPISPWQPQPQAQLPFGWY